MWPYGMYSEMSPLSKNFLGFYSIMIFYPSYMNEEYQQCSYFSLCSKFSFCLPKTSKRKKMGWVLSIFLYRLTSSDAKVIKKDEFLLESPQPAETQTKGHGKPSCHLQYAITMAALEVQGSACKLMSEVEVGHILVLFIHFT